MIQKMENNNSLEVEFAKYALFINLINEFEKEVQSTDMQIEITSSIRAITTAIDLTNKAFNLSSMLKNSELISAIGELKLALSRAEVELSNTITEAKKLENELEKLKSPEWQLIFNADHQVCYQKDDIELTTPFCPNCWNNDKKKNILSYLRKKDFNDSAHSCTCCHYQASKII
jgi:hypothetical protein